MACPEELHVHAYFDGETSAAEAARIEAHVQQCADCRALAEELGHLRTALRQDVGAPRAPGALRARVLDSLDREAAARGGAPGIRHGWRTWMHLLTWPAASALGGAALAGLLVFAWLAPLNGRERMLDDLLGAHVRSLMPAHLIDVESSDHHTVKPWFAGRTDVSPPVEDFAAQGYRLVGGRADFIAHQRAAVLVYAHGQHIINVFSWSGDRQILPASAQRDGYRVRCWSDGTLQSCAVTDTGRDELDRLVALLQEEAAAER